MRSVLRRGLQLALISPFVIVAAVAAAAAPPEPAPALVLPAGLRALYQQPGWQARVAAGTVIIVEAGFTHLRGVDCNGQPRWRAQYQPAPHGMQELFAFAGGAQMYAGERLLGVNPQSGALVSNTKVPFLTGSFERSADTGCWLNQSGGACSLSCACSFQSVSCKDGAAIGPHYDFDRICRQERDYESRSISSACGCWGHSGTLVGKSGDILVATLQGLRRANASAAPDDQGIAVGINTRTGAEVWRRELGIDPASYVNGVGVTASGRTCWLGDAFGTLTALDCQSGKTLWHVQSKAASPPHLPESWVAAVSTPAGIFHFSRAGATLYSERTGRPLWSRPAMGVSFTVPRGALPTGSSTSREAGTFVVLDPSSGQSIVTFTLEKDAVVLDAGRGQYLVQRGRVVQLYDSRGTVLAQATLPFAGTLELGEQLLVAAGAEGLSILDRDTLTLRGSLAGWFTVVALEQTLGPRRLVIERYGDHYYSGEQKLRQIALIEVVAAEALH